MGCAAGIDVRPLRLVEAFFPDSFTPLALFLLPTFPFLASPASVLPSPLLLLPSSTLQLLCPILTLQLKPTSPPVDLTRQTG